ncbi:hypothetical protein [Streptomyces sp. NBC_00344]|uniref:hypothetical protein n=1 Tax=Streptomyces sp. NBC_00344 TaxID=2975720 RepID=UPI002E24D54B
MFNVTLTPPTRRLPPEMNPGPLEDPEDYEYLVVYSCALLAKTDCKFHIGGFGSANWGFDVHYDASSFLEELPRMLRSATLGEDFDVDLYSQGVERNLQFTFSGTVVDIYCESRTNWVPEPPMESLNSDAVVSMLQNLATSFAASLKAVVPQVAMLPPFSDWA